jgi:hypothetical protein
MTKSTHYDDDEEWGDEEGGEDHDEFGHGNIDDLGEEYR